MAKWCTVALFALLGSLPSVQSTFTLVDEWNAVPSGSEITVTSVEECQKTCVDTCTQFSWNKNSHHCFTSTGTKWAGYSLDHVISGCDAARVENCGAKPGPSPSPPTPPAPEKYDGVLRSNGKGRMDAYLPPPFHSNHASMVEQLPDGSLHMAWFSGTQEGSDLVSIVYANVSSSAEGSTWSAAKVVSRREGYSNQNAVLHFDNVSSKLHLFHSQQAANSGESAATVWHLEAAWFGGWWLGSFSTPAEILTRPGSFNKNRVLPLLDGSWMLPVYEQGKTPNYPMNVFKPMGADPNKPASWTEGVYGTCENMVQPSVVRLKPGEPKLVAFFRDRKKRNIYSATSSDDGKTWTPCKATALPNNNAGIEAYSLRSGRIALVYNPQTNSRDPLAISLSEDEGKTWKYTRILEHLDGKSELSYPTLREDLAKDGVIHVSYTYKRECIKYSVVTEDWIMASSEVTMYGEFLGDVFDNVQPVATLGENIRQWARATGRMLV